MVIPQPQLGAETRQCLINQPVRHARIARKTLCKSGIARRHAAPLPPQQNTRSDSSFNP